VTSDETIEPSMPPVPLAFPGEGPLTRFGDRDLEVQQDLLAMLDLLAPMAVEGFKKVRIGGAHDGGYVMLDDFDGVEAAYSIGIETDVSWDADIASREIDVFQYDHTIDSAPEQNPRLFWRKLGLGAVADDAREIVTLARMLAENGHDDARNLLLKIDIEDAEWAVFAALDDRVLSQFRQIVLEMHFFENAVDPARRDLMRRAIATLTKRHRVVHVHGNNHAPWALVGSIAVPSVMEFTFARIDGGIFRPSDELFPTALDRPNRKESADYRLGHFRFLDGSAWVACSPASGVTAPPP